MNVLEKILEEIERLEDPYYKDYVDRKHVVEIIRSHMGDGNGTNVPSNDGWIPVEERLPEDGTYLCTLAGELCGIEEPFTGMCGIENGKWDEDGCVIAWQNIPEPYKTK